MDTFVDGVLYVCTMLGALFLLALVPVIIGSLIGKLLRKASDGRPPMATRNKQKGWWL